MAQLCSIVLTGCQCGPRARLFLSVGWPVLSPAPPYSSVAGGLCCLCSGTITIWPLPWATTPGRVRRGIVPRPPPGISCVRRGIVPVCAMEFPACAMASSPASPLASCSGTLQRRELYPVWLMRKALWPNAEASQCRVGGDICCT